MGKKRIETKKQGITKTKAAVNFKLETEVCDISLFHNFPAKFS